jgi:hypothetical protein
LSKSKFGQTAWHIAAQNGRINILQKLWDWAGELQLKPEDLRNEVWLSKNRWGQTAWHIAARKGNLELSRKLWDWAKEVQIKPEDLRNQVWMSNDRLTIREMIEDVPYL